MFYYRLYGEYIVSDMELSQLTQVSTTDMKEQTGILIQKKELPDELKRPEECYFSLEKDSCFLSNSYCYLLMEKGKRIFYEMKEKATPQLLNAYILGWGIATLFYQRGELAIHCSCIQKDGNALIISGNSGSGKSTITSELLKKGYSFMADDMSVVKFSENKEVLATAAYPYQKLCRDVAQNLDIPMEQMIYVDEQKDKFLVPYRGKYEETSAPVKAMIILHVTREDKVSIKELVGEDKLHASMNSLFLAPLLGEDLYRPENGIRVLHFASKVPIYQINRPLGKDTKEEIIKEILKIWKGKE